MASDKGSADGKLSMKLLVDTKGQRVLYAEAGKDVVDFIFSLLTLPLGTVAELLTAESMSMAGSVGNLYASVDKLDDTYICSDDAKDVLLTPVGGCGIWKLLHFPPAPAPESGCIYRCNVNSDPNTSRTYVTSVYGTQCPYCRSSMVTPAELVPRSGAAGSAGGGAMSSRAAVAGFVQGVISYTVTDDLTVAPPMSTIPGIALVNSFSVTDIGSLQEKTVQLGYTEGLEILKMSVQSKKVLTDVFLGKKPKPLERQLATRISFVRARLTR